MRMTAFMVLIVLFGSLVGYAENTFHAAGRGDGSVVLWFQGSQVTGTAHASLSFEAVVHADAETVAFSVQGEATGSGSGDMSTLNVSAWLLFDGSGTNPEGDPVVARGGISIRSLDAQDSGTVDGSGEGLFYITIVTPDAVIVAHGIAAGTASGGFVVPDDETSMKLQGAGEFELIGEVTSWMSVSSDTPTEIPVDDLPWDSSTVPEEFLAQLRELIQSPQTED